MKRPLVTSLVTFGLLLLPLGVSRLGSEKVPTLSLVVAQAAGNPYGRFSADNRYWGNGNNWWNGKGCYSKAVQFDCKPQPSSRYCNKDGSWNDGGYKCFRGHEHMRACYNKSGKSLRWWC
jgi:hypothetical protein